MARKQLLMDLLQQSHDEEKIYFDGLTQEQRDQSGTADNWAAKDVIAHVNYWKRQRADEVKNVMAGGTPTLTEDFDHENALVFERFCTQSWGEVMAYAEEATAALRAQLEKMSEADLQREWRNEQPLWRAIYNRGYFHPLAHIAWRYQETGDMRRAGEITGMLGEPTLGLDDSSWWKGLVMYNVACGHSLMGQKDRAVEELRRAFEARPNLAEWSKQDPDLDPLRDEPAFQALFESKK